MRVVGSIKRVFAVQNLAGLDGCCVVNRGNPWILEMAFAPVPLCSRWRCTFGRGLDARGVWPAKFPDDLTLVTNKPFGAISCLNQELLDVPIGEGDCKRVAELATACANTRSSLKLVLKRAPSGSAGSPYKYPASAAPIAECECLNCRFGPVLVSTNTRWHHGEGAPLHLLTHGQIY